MKTIVTVNLALFSALIVAGSRLEATEGQNITISFDIDEVEKADEVKITFKGVNKKQPSVIARRPWIYDDKPPAGVSLLVEKGRVYVTIQHVNISSSGLYTALAVGRKVLKENATLFVNKASFSSTTAPPHTSIPKPPKSSDLLWLCALIPLLIVISVGVYFWKCRRPVINVSQELMLKNPEKPLLSPDPVSAKNNWENNCSDFVAVHMNGCGEDFKS